MEKNINIEIGDTFFDIESLHNIFTLAAYIPGMPKNNFFIAIHCDLYDNGVIPENEHKRIKDEIYQVNEHEFNKQGVEYNDLQIMTLNKFIAMLLAMLEQNKFPRFFGWNSRNYDALFLSYIIWKYRSACALEADTAEEKQKHFDSLNEPVVSAKELREFSDKMINNKKATYAFEYNKDAKNFYYELRNNHRFIDVQQLNELMSNESLKRISAQLGLKILESDKLSGPNAYVETLDDIAELSAYNYVDVINMYNIFLTKPYFGPFNQKSDIIRRFDKEYQGMLGPDTTSANLVEHMIIPVKNKNLYDLSEQLEDDPYIHFFYPTRYDNNEKLVNIEKEITDLKYDLLEHYDLDEVDVTIDRKLQEELITRLNLKPDRPRYRYNSAKETLEEDLLEMAVKEYQLPQEVYDFYAMFRNKPNIDQVRDDFKNHNVKQFELDKVKEDITDVPLYTDDRMNITVFVRDSNSYITYAAGGLHGEYVDQQAFWNNFYKELEKRDEAEAFNKSLQKIKSVYGNSKEAAEQFRNTKKDGGIKEEVKEFDKHQYKYATYSKEKGFNWKKEKAVKSIVKIIQGSKAGGKSKSMIKAFSKTVDATNVGHDDIDSMYPSLLKALEVFKRIVNGHVIDNFSTMLDERLKLKYFLEDLKRKGIPWTEENNKQDKLQKDNKLLLNSASGKADGSFDNKIKVNNKMLSTRICGQLILSYLIFKITDNGGLCVSSNTDGVYYTGISNKEVSKINDEWCYYFRMAATPETIDKFISKSSNDRIEIVNEKQNDGSIEQSLKPSGSSLLAHKGYNAIKKSTKPNIVDNMLVKYFKDYDHALRTFDKDYLKAYLERMIGAAKARPDKFLHKTLNLFQWTIKDGIGSNQYYIPINLDNGDVYTKSSTKRFFLVKESDYVLAKYVVNKQNKEEDPAIRQSLIDLGHVTENTPGNANIRKPSYLSIDFSENKIEVHQESLDEISIDILDNLDLDKYIDIAEEVWSTWSNSYVEIYQDDVA